MNDFTVVLDACVLYPEALRNLLLHMAVVDLYRAKWTEQIHQEWMENLLGKRPSLSREKIERTRQLMDENVRDSLVTGYESLIEGLRLPDPGDRHVLAAAIRCNADLIVTRNLDDFPAEFLEPFGIEAQHPDVFIYNQLSLDQAKVLTAIQRARANYKNPPYRPLDYLELLERQGLPMTVSELRRYADVI